MDKLGGPNVTFISLQVCSIFHLTDNILHCDFRCFAKIFDSIMIIGVENGAKNSNNESMQTDFKANCLKLSQKCDLPTFGNERVSLWILLSSH